MKCIILLFVGLFFSANQILAQKITVGTIQKNHLCTGDTVWVPYIASGTFAPDNTFTLQLSDASGSFSTFQNRGHSTNPNDSIPIIFGGAGNYWRLRIIATNPYTISDNTSDDIRVVNYPTPAPTSNLLHQYGLGGPGIGFIGDSIQFEDKNNESPGSTSFWAFDQSANLAWTTIKSPTIQYTSAGFKEIRLSVTNDMGCTTSKWVEIRIFNCNPTIPDTVHIVTGNETGTFPYVWVKAGGSYTAVENRFNLEQTVFVEPGAALNIGFRSIGIYYVKAGASVVLTTDQGYAVIFLQKGADVPIKPNVYSVDTLYCNDLQFDYSQVIQKGIDEKKNPLQILNSGNTLQITNEGAEISVSLFTTLGIPILSKSERDLLTFDLSSFTDGLYFAQVSSGNHHEIRKIIVVH
jgi:hypothetical protein